MYLIPRWYTFEIKFTVFVSFNVSRIKPELENNSFSIRTFAGNVRFRANRFSRAEFLRDRPE